MRTTFAIATAAAFVAAENVSVLHDATYDVEGPICDGTTGTCPKKGDVAVAACRENLNSYVRDTNQCVAPEDGTCVQHGDLLFKCEFTSTTSPTTSPTPGPTNAPSPGPAGPSPAPGPTDAPSPGPAGPSPAPGPTDAPSPGPAGPTPAPGPTDAPSPDAPSPAPTLAPKPAPATPASSSASSATIVGLTALVASIAYFL